MIVVASKQIAESMEVERAEATAAKEGLVLAQDIRLRYIILEEDGKNIFEAFSNSERDYSHAGSILSHAFNLVSKFSFF